MMRLVVDQASRNRLLRVIRSREITLFEVGLNGDDSGAWPIAVNVVQLDRHFYLSPSLARELGKALIEAAAQSEQSLT